MRLKGRAEVSLGAKMSRIDLERIRKDFSEAITRIQKGRPKHPDLVARQREGKLVLNPTTAAMESGRSRTYVGHAGCALPDIRSRILSEGSRSVRIGSMKEVVKSLKERVSELEQQAKIKDSAIAALQIALSRARPKTHPRIGNVTPFRKKTR